MSTLIPPKKQNSDELIQFAKKPSTATISGALSKRGFRFLYMAGERHRLPRRRRAQLQAAGGHALPAVGGAPPQHSIACIA